ncbi:MAG: hypothetical protein IKF05_06925 [Erysipelotrichaceae bacterium]|nr:hypothetical protein [Erysipelotrichaceae bacterium]
MKAKYQEGQKVFLTGARPDLIEEATVFRYAGGMYTIRFKNGGGIRVREDRIYPTRKDAEEAINRRRSGMEAIKK